MDKAETANLPLSTTQEWGEGGPRRGAVSQNTPPSPTLSFLEGGEGEARSRLYD